MGADGDEEDAQGREESHAEVVLGSGMQGCCELQHILMGHSGHQRPAVEKVVRAAAARKLISLEDLIAARSLGYTNQCDVAVELRVTPAVFLDRINDLDEKERDALHITD